MRYLWLKLKLRTEQIALSLILCWLTLLAGGCGGGTSGTGIKSYEGVVKNAVNDEPLPNVTVTEEETGASTVTDPRGQFLLVSEAKGEELQFHLESDEFESRFIVHNVPEESARVTVEVAVDVQEHSIQVEQLSMRAGMVGACDRYFENHDVIRQSNRVPSNTLCTLKAIVLGDGQRRSNVPVALQVRACQIGAEWRTLQVVKTDSGVHRGVAQISFPYLDSISYCQYRLVAPFEYKDYRPVTFPLHTYTAQNVATELVE